ALRRSLFLISASVVFITFALPLRAEDLGASAIQIGALYSLLTAAVFVMRPLSGYGLDALGRRPMFLAAAGAYFAANVLYAASGDVIGLFAARLMQGIGFAILAIAADTITADIADQNQRSAAMGANIASQTRGGMVGATFAFTLVGVAPLIAWVVSFWMFSVVSLLATVFVFFAIPETRPRRTAESGVAKKYVMPTGYVRVLVIIFLAAFAGALIQPYYLIYIRARFDVELYMLATAFLPVGIAYAILPGVLGKAADRFSRVSAISVGLIIAASFYLLAPRVDGFFTLVGMFLGAAIGAVLVDLTKNAWVADLSESAAVGRSFGLAALAAGGGGVLGPIAGGAIYDSIGPDYLFYGAALILFAAALSTQILFRTR
ncbi:MAG: MFS transporter, partial [Pseudomonadota bacterium]